MACIWVNPFMIAVPLMGRSQRLTGLQRLDRLDVRDSCVRLLPQRFPVGTLLVRSRYDGAVQISPLADHFSEEVPGAAPDHKREHRVADDPENFRGEAHPADALRGG